MSDENENVPGTTGEPSPQESQGATAPADDGAVTEETYEIPETMADVATEEPVLEDSTESTEETVSLTVQETIELVGSDICHVSLFGSFLICGTLIGLAPLRKVYGT